jgi:hypothetical protein
MISDNLAVLNPTIKFEWLEKHWTLADYTAARKLVRDAVSIHQLNIKNYLITLADAGTSASFAQ